MEKSKIPSYDEFLVENVSLKDFEKYKTSIIIPLKFTKKDFPMINPLIVNKLHLLAGIKISEKINNFGHTAYDFYVFSGVLYFALTHSGIRIIKVRSKKRPDYLKWMIDIVNDSVGDVLNKKNINW